MTGRRYDYHDGWHDETSKWVEFRDAFEGNRDETPARQATLWAWVVATFIASLVLVVVFIQLAAGRAQ